MEARKITKSHSGPGNRKSKKRYNAKAKSNAEDSYLEHKRRLEQKINTLIHEFKTLVTSDPKISKKYVHGIKDPKFPIGLYNYLGKRINYPGLVTLDNMTFIQWATKMCSLEIELETKVPEVKQDKKKHDEKCETLEVTDAEIHVQSKDSKMGADDADFLKQCQSSSENSKSIVASSAKTTEISPDQIPIKKFCPVTFYKMLSKFDVPIEELGPIMPLRERYRLIQEFKASRNLSSK